MPPSGEPAIYAQPQYTRPEYKYNRDKLSTISLFSIRSLYRYLALYGEKMIVSRKPADVTKFLMQTAASFAEACLGKRAWFRAPYADETLAGFLMLHDEPDTTDGPRHYHWRVMLDIPNS